MTIPNNGEGYAGLLDPSDLGSEYATMVFVIKSILNKIAGATLVQVKSVTNDGGVTPVGLVDILPLVNQTDGAGNAIPHAIIYNCPYFRLQGGTNAIILDPQVGDIGIAIFADGDISSVVENKNLPNPQSNPGSWRKFSMADGLYIGGVLNKVPVQFVEFQTTGITITSPQTITINAGKDLIANVAGNMTSTVQGNSTATIQGTSAITSHGASSIASDANVTVTAGGNASVSATGSLSATAGSTATVSASASITVTAPAIALTGATTVTGLFTVNGATMLNGAIAQVSGVGGSGATMAGPLNVTGAVTSGSVSLTGHVHTGVQAGSNSTGPAV